MPVSDQQVLAAWKHVLRLSRLTPGETVTVLTGPDTHPQTLSSALIAAEEMAPSSIGSTCRRKTARSLSAATASPISAPPRCPTIRPRSQC